MVAKLLEDLSPGNFMVQLQTWAEILTIFYTTCRGSSITPAHQQYADQKKVSSMCITDNYITDIPHSKYLQLGQFKIKVMGRYSWHVTLDLRNFKVCFSQDEVLKDDVRVSTSR
jgi:hypothetical protein